MSEWKEHKLGEIADVQTGPFGSQLHQSDYVDVGIPSIMPVNIGDRMNISTKKIVFITEEDAIRLSRYRVKEGDIVYSRRGDVEKCAYIGKAENGWLCGTGCLRISIDSSKADSKFIAYFLSTEDMKSWISNNAVGTTMPNLNSSILQQVPLSLPSLDEQKRIASILSSLDDKIDLLNRENATLEAMAEALFRQWFIEEAKEDWEENPLSSIATFLNGLACQKYPPKNEIEKLPVLKIRELSNGIGADSDWATTDVGDEYIVHAGDVIFAWSASLMVKIWDGEDCILNQHLFKVTSDKYPKWFYYFWCKHHLNEFISIAQSHATTMGHIKRSDLDTAMVLVPSDEDLEKMTEQMEYILLKKSSNCDQLRTLIKSRNIILPKLMSEEGLIK